MVRIARVVAPGYPHHVTQRGNNRATVFFDDKDRLTYLRLLTHYTDKHDLSIWAYCLMDNHVHLLVVPGEEKSLAHGIGLTNQVYTQYLNRKTGNSGRIWQNRFFSCIIDQENYLWTAVRYIECNPVKAGLVAMAEDYQWSSAKAHLLGYRNPLLADDHWLDPKEREDYRAFVLKGNDTMEDYLCEATKKGLPFGSPQFIDLLETDLQVNLRVQKRGRPPKARKE